MSCLASVSCLSFKINLYPGRVVIHYARRNCSGRWLMPTYEYECRTCGHAFEEFQSIKAEPLTACPREDCDGTVKKLISAGAGLLFKGSGFYITDYRSDGYKASAKADAANGSGSGAKGGGAKDGGGSKDGSSSSGSDSSSSGDKGGSNAKSTSSSGSD